MSVDKLKAGCSIYMFLRNVVGKKQTFKFLRDEIDCTLQNTKKEKFKGLELFQAARKLMFVYQVPIDDNRFIQLCGLLLDNMEQQRLKGSYIAVSLDRRFSVPWIYQMKKILGLCCEQLRLIEPKNQKSEECLDIYMNMLGLFTDYTLWKFTAQLGETVKRALHLLCIKLVEHLIKCNFYGVMQRLLDKVLLTSHVTGYSLTAMMGFRQLAICSFPPNMLVEFTTTVLSVPGCIFHLEQRAPESLSKLRKVDFVCRLLRALESSKDQLAMVDVNSALSILGNLAHLCSLQIEEIETNKEIPLMLAVLKQVIKLCESDRLDKGSNMSCWHPFFGWIKAGIDRRNVGGLTKVREQFHLLWSRRMVQAFLTGVLELEPVKAREKRKFSVIKGSGSTSIKECTLKEISDGCDMYLACLQMFPLLSADVLLALSCNGDVVSKLWLLLNNSLCLKVNHAFQMITSNSSRQSPLYPVLVLAVQVTQYFLATLDDEELHVQQQYFAVDSLRDICLFLNELVCKMILEDEIKAAVFPHCHSLLTVLYRRDCRRSFTGDSNFWIIRKLKADVIIKDLKSKKKYATNLLKHIPHCIPRKQRVEIFSEWIRNDKRSLGLLDRSHQQPATYITIQRSRILEGGYEQLSSLSVKALKGIVRVKFVNEQGLDEAGIDETGVFKEFLEEVISKAFDPCLNLFKVSSQELLYPSPSSSIQENHLSLFEFIGKMLAKAVYEGIVVDVQFAPFFLSQMLEYHMSSLYSSLDELVSLDPDLYKSISYIKHAESGIEDLSLTFTWDEECLGKVISHELIPGGSSVQVTAANRISYVHRMSYFMLYTRLMKQSKAFVQGFYSIINRSWIELFSPHELQSLISGEQVGISIEELKKHAQYGGGYHANHRVILWLWEVLVNDFNAKERGAFLKFVTSCSRPPLLGFSNLSPPFTIRCVDLTEEEDRVSVGSVLKGFFSFRQQSSSSRLPTASTCFNLLKLPNYTRKSLLREKLRYSILSNSGFELS